MLFSFKQHICTSSTSKSKICDPYTLGAHQEGLGLRKRKNQDNRNSEKVTCGACPEEMGNESDLAELPFPLQLAVVLDSPFPVMSPWLSFRELDSRMSRRPSHTSTRKQDFSQYRKILQDKVLVLWIQNCFSQICIRDQ